MADATRPFSEQSGFFNAFDHLRLYWRACLPERPRAAIALVHGYADHSGRYLPVLHHFAGLGYAVHAFDYRGHGQSDGRRGHCDHFSDYLSDLDVFLRRVREQSKTLPLFLLAHSHGALVAARYALDHPEVEQLAGAILTGAYLRLAFPPPKLKVLLAKVVGRVVPFLPVGLPLDSPMLTHDEAVQKATDQDPLYNRTTTPRWFQESNRAQAEVLARAAEFCWPLLVLHGGADPIAALGAAQEFEARAGSTDKSIVVYDGFLHEVLDEVGCERVWKEIADWMEKRG